MTNEEGNIVQTLDYYPYGKERIAGGDNKTDRHYIGEYYDATGLNYLQARYYDSARGQFLSQDPVFWEIGQSKDGVVVLKNPQLQNSYSYAGNNPIINKDPDGRCPICIATSPLFISTVALGIGSAALTTISTVGYYWYRNKEMLTPTLESLAGQPPRGSGFIPTPNTNVPRWLKIIMGTFGLIKVYDDVVQETNDKVESIKNILDLAKSKKSDGLQDTGLTLQQGVNHQTQLFNNNSVSQTSFSQQYNSLLDQINSLQKQINELRTSLQKSTE